MYPGTNNPQAQPQGPGALPQIQPVSSPPAAFMQQTPPAPQPAHDLPSAVEQVKLLANQYGSNPYAFNMAFQQLKNRYLLDHFHIDPNTESK